MAGLCAGVALGPSAQPSRCRFKLLKLKLRTKAQSCLSSPNYSFSLQLADVCWLSHTCTVRVDIS